MQLVLFTGHYPFGSGEEFLENEIRVAEKYFDKITVVTIEKNPSNITRYVPQNAKIVPVREKARGFRRVFNCILCLPKMRVWKEMIYAKRTTAYSSITVLKQILIQENAMSYIRNYESEWLNPEHDTVYYSYWLGTDFVINNSRLQGLKISRAHGGDCFYSRGYHPYRREALNNIDFVFSISEAGCKDIIEHYECAIKSLKQKVKVARLGIEIPCELNPFIDKKVKTIVTCSNIIQLKRLDLMIDALSKISEVEIEWVHFGDGELKGKILQVANKQLNSKKNIRFDFRGYTPNSAIADFYKSNSVDLFVNCSDVEGIPVSVMEAMSYGIPAIGRNVGGLRELIDASCGKILPEIIKGNELALAISEILNLPSKLYESMRKNAHEKIEKLYNAKENYHELFENIRGYLNANE